jgi:hypothetical protein
VHREFPERSGIWPEDVGIASSRSRSVSELVVVVVLWFAGKKTKESYQ